MDLLVDLTRGRLDELEVEVVGLGHHSARGGARVVLCLLSAFRKFSSGAWELGHYLQRDRRAFRKTSRRVSMSKR